MIGGRVPDIREPNAVLTGRQRMDARPARCMMNQGAARAWWPAVGAPFERRVRRHRVLCCLKQELDFDCLVRELDLASLCADKDTRNE